MSLTAFALGVAVLGGSAGTPSTPAPLVYAEIVTGGAAADAELPLVVVLHGRGGSAERFGRRFAGWGVPARVVVLQGPERSGDGFAWFERPLRALDDAAFDAALEVRVDQVYATVAHIEQTRPTVDGQVVLAGYSQGAAVALATGLRHPELAADVVVASTWLPERWAAAPPAGPRPRVYASHGRADRRLPVAQARKLYGRLAAAGLAVKMDEVPGAGHRLRGRAGHRFFRELRRSVTSRT